LLAGALLIVLVGCAKKPVEVYQWRLQSQATDSSEDFKQLLVLADNVKVMSGGRFIITPLSGGNVTNGPDIFVAVKERRVEMGNGWPNWWSGQHPAWAVMNAGPFDFMNLDASMQFFLAGAGTALANELSMPEGVIWRPAWWPGMEFGLISKQAITGIDDLVAKKIRVGPGLPSELLAAAGAYSIPLVPQEIRPALENGELDAVEWTTTSGAWDLGLQDIATHAIVPAIWQPSVLSDFLINQAAFNELPQDLQRILETAIRAYTLTTTMANKVNDIAALKKFQQSGTQINKWSEQDIERWRTLSDVIYEQYRQRDDFSKRLIDAKKHYKQAYDEYYEWFGPYE
jgi:TRAP-type mannitol/chloroaromatic compound transport system substrate-binding protein